MVTPPSYTRRLLNQRTASKGRSLQCPEGYTQRRGYVRRFGKNIIDKGYTVKRRDGKTYRIKPEKEAVEVKPVCVKDRHPPGKLYGHIRRGEFKKHGYSYIADMKARRDALEKAVVEFGAPSVYYKLRALVRAAKRSVPEASKVFKEDMHWIDEKYKLKGH